MIHLSAASSEQVEDLVERERLTTPHPWTASSLKGSLLGSADCLLIQKHKDTLGYLVVQQVLDEAELLNFVIFKPHGSKGYGYAALLKLQDQLLSAGIRKIHLEVRASNHVARALYQKAGFTRTALRANYYRPGGASVADREDAILMCWCC